MTGFALQIVNLPELRQAHDKLLANTITAIAEAEHTAGEDAVNFVKRYPGFKPRTGKLQAATTYRTIRTSNGRILRIENPKKYAGIIDAGSRPHRIVAKNGKALRFMGGGRVLFRRSVNHPGTRPYKTFYRATFSAYRSMGHDLTRRMTALASRF